MQALNTHQDTAFRGNQLINRYHEREQEITPEKVRDAVRAWASSINNQDVVTGLIVEEWERQGGYELDFPADLSRQRQKLFRWLDGATPAAKTNVRLLTPAILAVLPVEFRGRLVSQDCFMTRFSTYGTTSATVPDTYGNPHVISFSRSTDVPIYGHITLKALSGYTSNIGVQIQEAVADYINSLTIGDSVRLSRIYSPANLGVVSGGNARYYDIEELLIGKSAGSVVAANVTIAYDESASCNAENIVLTVTS